MLTTSDVTLAAEVASDNFERHRSQTAIDLSLNNEICGTQMEAGDTHQ